MMERLLGASWRSSLATYGTAFAAYLYTHPERLHGIPEPWQGWLWTVLEYLMYAGLLTIGHTVKDKAVTGGRVKVDTPVEKIIHESTTVDIVTEKAKPVVVVAPPGEPLKVVETKPVPSKNHRPDHRAE